MRWLVLAMCGGCAFIPESDHLQKLDALQEEGITALPPLDVRIEQVDPAAIADCAVAAELTVTASVDPAWIGETLVASWQLDDGPLTAIGSVEVTAGDDGRGALEVLVGPLECPDADCALVLSLTTAAGDPLATSEPFPLAVVDELLPEPLAIVVYDADIGAWFDWSTLETVAQADPRGAVLQSRFQRLRIAVDDPLHGTPWSVDTATAAVVACPFGVSPILDPDGCAFVPGVPLDTPTEVHASANLAYEIDLWPIAQHLCGTEDARATDDWSYYAAAVEHVCAEDVLFPLGTEPLRIVLDDCDGDGIHVDTDCDDDEPSVPGPVTFFDDFDGDGFGDADAPLGTACEPPPYTSGVGDDCDDATATTFPGAPELCNGIDDDCDPLTGEDGLVTRSGVPEATLADAITNAIDGDDIVLCSGTHMGPAVADGKALTIRGLERSTTIQGTAGAPATAVLDGGSLILQTLTITGGTGAPGPTGPEGGGIHAINAALLHVDDVTIAGNTASLGAGVAAVNTDLVEIVNSEIRDNDASTGSGGGLYADGALVLTNVTVRANTAMEGGGATGAGTWTITDTTFDANSATTKGGGVLFGGSELTLTRATFTSNGAQSGGGLYQNVGTLLATDCTFTGNEAQEHGGGLHAELVTVTVTNGAFEDNVATLKGGGAAFGGLLGDATITGTVFLGNLAPTGAGGGIYVEATPSLILDGVTLVFGDAYEGGGLRAMESTVTLEGGTVADNTADIGGGISLTNVDLVLDGTMVASNSAIGQGGGVLVDAGSATATGFANVHGNSADAGGGFYVVEGTVTLNAGTAMGLGPTENAPDDVYLADTRFPVTAGSWNWTGLLAETTTCVVDSTEASCTP